MSTSLENDEPEVPCLKCGKRFRTPRGALQHQIKCMAAEIRVDLNENETDTPNANKEPDQNDPVIPESFYWVEAKGSDFTYKNG